MRPVVVTAILLVVMMFMLESAAVDMSEDCKKDPPIPCRQSSAVGWFQLGTDRCVKVFHTQHMTFWNAERTCNSYRNGEHKGHLVSIHNMDEQDQVECTMYRATTGKLHYWIGLYRVTAFGHFAWTDGTSHDFSSWAGGQPDYAWGIENGIEMNYWDWGLWNDRYNDDALPYVCAIRV